MPNGFTILMVYPGPIPGSLDEIKRAYPPPLFPSQSIKWGGEWNDYKSLRTDRAIFVVEKSSKGAQKLRYFYLDVDEKQLHEVALITQKSFLQRWAWGPLKKWGLCFLAELITHKAAEAIPFP